MHIWPPILRSYNVLDTKLDIIQQQLAYQPLNLTLVKKQTQMAEVRKWSDIKEQMLKQKSS